MRAAFIEFFHDSGDGLSKDLLQALSAKFCDPVLDYISKNAQELIRTFYVKASAQQAATAFASLEAPVVATTALDGNNSVQQGAMALLADKPGPTATRSTLGRLEIEMTYNRQTDEATLRIIRAMDLPADKTYINLRLLPSFGQRPFKFRSTPAVPGVSPRYNETVLVPDISLAEAVQIRIQERGFSLSMDKVVGEVLLSVQELRRRNGTVVSMPLHPLVYEGELGWIQFAIMVSWAATWNCWVGEAFAFCC